MISQRRNTTVSTIRKPRECPAKGKNEQKRKEKKRTSVGGKEKQVGRRENGKYKSRGQCLEIFPFAHVWTSEALIFSSGAKSGVVHDL